MACVKGKKGSAAIYELLITKHYDADYVHDNDSPPLAYNLYVCPSLSIIPSNGCVRFE